MEFPHGSSTPKRCPTPNNSPAHLQQQSSPSSQRGGGSGSAPTSGTKNALSKLFTQLKNLIVEAAIEQSDVAPGVDTCCKTSRCHYGLPIHHLDCDTMIGALGTNISQCSSSPGISTSTGVSSRLIVYRDCDRRGRKILFDSEHVTSDYVYQKPSDPKLLKELGEYVFGCVPLASCSRSMDLPPNFGHKRFCKWKLEGPDHPRKTLYIWSKIFELSSSYKANNNSTSTERAKTVDYSSSSSDQSSSGYESGGGASSSYGASKTFSLPLFNQRPSSRSSSQSTFPETRSLPGRIDSYKTNLALVWILSQDDSDTSADGSPSLSSAKIPFPYLSPLIENLMLNPLSSITQNFYHNSNHFVTGLKNISTTLNYDLSDFLSNPHVVNLSLVKPPLPDMVNNKLVCKFLELILTNMDSCIVLNLKSKPEVKAILYFLKMFLRTFVCKCNLLDSRRDSLVETGTDVISMASSSSPHDLDCVDSGIELEGSTSSRMHAVSSSSMYQSGRKWSIVSEEGSEFGGGESSQDESDCGRVSFHLGDADCDQSEAKLGLGEIDLTKLKRGERRLSVESTSSEPQPEITPSPVKRPPLEIKLNLSDSKLKDTCPVKYTPCYHCNGTYITEHNRFNPFYFCQVIAKPGEVAYGMEYINFIKIIELYGTGLTRSFNLNEEGSTSSTSTTSSTLSLSGEDSEAGGECYDLVKKIKEFVEGYVKLAKVTNDSGKLDSYVTFQLEEIQDYIP